MPKLTSDLHRSVWGPTNHTTKSSNLGALKHLEACKNGLIGNVSDTEFLACHLKNVFEIACLSCSLTSFSDPSWIVAREYDTRVISDIEAGAKSWETLSSGIE